MTFPFSTRVPDSSSSSHTLPDGARFHLPKFRGDVPVYESPSREEWAAKHGGAAPRRIERIAGTTGAGREIDLLAIHGRRAQAAVALDGESITFAEAMAAQSRLSEICLAVQTDAGVSQDDHVFFDPADGGQFWIYPAK